MSVKIFDSHTVFMYEYDRDSLILYTILSPVQLQLPRSITRGGLGLRIFLFRIERC